MPSSPEEDRASGGTKTTNIQGTDEEERKVFVPADPEQWNKDHILEWLKWVEVTFSTSPIDGTCMPADGATLCNLTAEDFHNITGDSTVAGILFSHLTSRREACGHDPKPLSNENSWSEKNGKNFLASVRELIGENIKEEEKDLTSSNGGGQIQLWQFLIYLLQQPGNESLIVLEGDDGEFRLLDPEGVAKKWGERKSKPNMNYDKLSRALRYYYDKGILSKVNGKRYTYKFDVNGLRRAIRPTGLSDTYFIQPNFDVSNYTSIRNFNFPNLLLDKNMDGSSLLIPKHGSSEQTKFR